MIAQCLNKSFHKKMFRYEGHYRGYCTDPDCLRDRKNKASKKSQEKNKELYKTVYSRYRKNGKKLCINEFCRNTTNNRFGYCDACREHILSGIDPNFLLIGINRHNGSPMFVR